MKKVVLLFTVMFVLVATNSIAYNNFIRINSSPGFELWKHNSDDTYVQVVSLNQNASIKLLLGDIVDPGEDESLIGFGGDSPSIQKQDMREIWDQHIENDDKAVSLTNGVHFEQWYPFYQNTEITYPLKIDNWICGGVKTYQEGYFGATSNGLKMLEIWDDEKGANIRPISKLSSVYGHLLTGEPFTESDKMLVGFYANPDFDPMEEKDDRLFIGLKDKNQITGMYNKILILSTDNQTISESVNTLIDFGVADDNSYDSLQPLTDINYPYCGLKVIQLDGGGSAQLFVKNQSGLKQEYIRRLDGRNVPQAIAVYSSASGNVGMYVDGFHSDGTSQSFIDFYDDEELNGGTGEDIFGVPTSKDGNGVFVYMWPEPVYGVPLDADTLDVQDYFINNYWYKNVYNSTRKIVRSVHGKILDFWWDNYGYRDYGAPYTNEIKHKYANNPFVSDSDYIQPGDEITAQKFEKEVIGSVNTLRKTIAYNPTYGSSGKTDNFPLSEFEIDSQIEVQWYASKSLDLSDPTPWPQAGVMSPTGKWFTKAVSGDDRYYFFYYIDGEATDVTPVYLNEGNRQFMELDASDTVPEPTIIPEESEIDNSESCLAPLNSAVICHEVTRDGSGYPMYPYDPVNESYVISPEDGYIYAWIRLDPISSPVDVKWIWREASGAAIQNITKSFGASSTWQKEWTRCNMLNADVFGDWTVEIFVDDVLSKTLNFNFSTVVWQPINHVNTLLYSGFVKNTWQGDLNNDSYLVYRNGSYICSTDNQYFKDYTVEPNTGYYYEVVAKKGTNAYSERSERVYVTTPEQKDQVALNEVDWSTDNIGTVSKVTDTTINEEFLFFDGSTSSRFTSVYLGNIGNHLFRTKLKFDTWFKIVIDAESDISRRYLEFSSDDFSEGVDTVDSRYIHNGIGEYIADGNWHTIIIDLLDALQGAYPNETIVKINKIFLYGKGCVEDFSFKDNIQTLFDDAEGTTSVIWTDDNSGIIENIFDTERASNVIHLQGINGATCFTLDDNGSYFNVSGSPWVVFNVKTDKYLKMRVKIITTAGDYRHIELSSDKHYVDLGDGYYRYPVGHHVVDSKWHFVAVNIQEILDYFEPGAELAEILKFFVYTDSNVYLDNMMAGTDYDRTVYAYGLNPDLTTTGWITNSTNTSYGAEIIYDTYHGSDVINLVGDNATRFTFRNPDSSDWNVSGKYIAELSFATNTANKIQFDVNVDNAGTTERRFLEYRLADGTDYLSDIYSIHFLGWDYYVNTGWKSIELDLEADLTEFEPDVTLINVTKMYIWKPMKCERISLEARN